MVPSRDDTASLDTALLWRMQTVWRSIYDVTAATMANQGGRPA